MVALGTVLANTQFEVLLKAHSKDVEFTLLSYTPNSVGHLEVEKKSGKLLGYIYDVVSPKTCVIHVEINDGSCIIYESYTIYLQPNYEELSSLAKGKYSLM